MFPTIRELATDLAALKRAVDWADVKAAGSHDFPPPEPDDEPYIDVRLQCVDGGWAVHEGDPCYDTDHRGFWGAGSLSPRTNVRVLARDLIEEAKDDAAQCEGV